jgi:hypothetical protein
MRTHIRSCCPLLRMDGNEVYPIYQSAKDYLLRKTRPAGSDHLQLIDEAEANLQVGRILQPLRALNINPQCRM